MICGSCALVSPVLFPNGATAGGDGDHDAEVEEEIMDPKNIMLKDPIVGVESTTLTEDGRVGAREPRELPSPKTPTEAQRRKHDLTHLPYASWCPFCVSCRRANSHHRQSHESERVIPLLVGDYGFLRDNEDDDSTTILVLRLYPYKIFFTIVVENKGPDPVVTERIARFIKDCGLIHFTYRSDREPAIMSMIGEACRRAGRPGGIPETSRGEQEVGKGVLDACELDDPGEDASPSRIDKIDVAAPEHSMPG